MARRISSSQFRSQISRAKSQLRTAQSKLRTAQHELERDLRKLESSHRRAVSRLRAIRLQLQRDRDALRQDLHRISCKGYEVVEISVQQWSRLTASERVEVEELLAEHDLQMVVED